MRRLLTAGVLILAAGLLTGCEPAPIPIVAVTVTGGSPALVLVACNRAFTQVGVFEDGSASSPGDDVLVRWGVQTTAPGDVTDVVMFQVPAGWDLQGATRASVSAAHPTASLTALVAGQRYGAAGDNGARAQARFVHFTTADLDKLQPSEVIVADSDGKGRVVSRSTFIRKARASCPR